MREQAHRSIAAEHPGERQQVVIGIDVGQRRLMPGIAQEPSPTFAPGSDNARPRFIVLLAGAERPRRTREPIQRSGKVRRLIGEDGVSDTDQLGQFEPMRRTYSHPSMIGQSRHCS